MKDVVSRTYFISAFRAGESQDVNMLRHAELLHTLKAEGLAVTPVEGRYGGVDELSFAVRGDQALERHLIEAAMILKQESILVVYHDSAAELIYTTPDRLGERLVIGHFEGTDVIKQGQDFSRIGQRFYVVRGFNKV